MNINRKFFNPENLGITCSQSRDFGIGKIGWNPEIAIPIEERTPGRGEGKGVEGDGFALTLASAARSACCDVSI